MIGSRAAPRAIKPDRLARDLPVPRDGIIRRAKTTGRM